MSTPATKTPPAKVTWGAASTLGVGGAAAAVIPLLVDALSDERIDPSLRKLLVIVAAVLALAVIVGRQAQAVVAELRRGKSPADAIGDVDLIALREAVDNLAAAAEQPKAKLVAESEQSHLATPPAPFLVQSDPTAIVDDNIEPVPSVLPVAEAEAIALDVADLNDSDTLAQPEPPEPDAGDADVSEAER